MRRGSAGSPTCPNVIDGLLTLGFAAQARPEVTVTPRLKPLVAKVFPLPEASEALTALLSRRYAGKIVLET